MTIPITLKSQFLDRLTEEEFYQFCQEHRDLRIERSHLGEIIIMPPVTLDSGELEGEAFDQVKDWNKKKKPGKVYSPSTGFTLPDGSVRSPDTSWVILEKITSLTPEERKKFAHVTPDFVIEIASPSDSINTLKEKMVRYINNGVHLGFLIDPEKETSWIYRANGSIEINEGFDRKLSGEDVLPGFELDLSRLRLEV